MSKKKVTPEMMNVIINCQLMKGKIYPNYDQFADFKNLSLLTIEQLDRLQERLIPEYNKTFAVSQ
jgi:hypothetical protein